MIKPGLDIYNPSDPKDRDRFEAEVLKDPKDFYIEYSRHSKTYIPNDLAAVIERINKRVQWADMENPAVMKIVRSLGYDGIESSENKTTNILVFDSNNISIIDNKYWKIIPADTSKEAYDFFYKVFGNDFDKKERNDTRTAKLYSGIPEYTKLSNTTKDRTFNIQVIHSLSDDKSYKYDKLSLDLLDYLNDEGHLDEDEMEATLDHHVSDKNFEGFKFHEKEYTKDELLKYLKSKYSPIRESYKTTCKSSIPLKRQISD